MFFGKNHFFKQFMVLKLLNKRIFYLIVLVLFSNVFISCDKIPSEVIENKWADYQVISVSAPQNFNYASADSSFSVAAQIKNPQSVSKIWSSVKTVDGSLTVQSEVSLQETVKNENIMGYSAKIPMSKRFPSGKYLIEFFVEDNVNLAGNNVNKVGEILLSYNNNQTIYPPVISNLVLPTSVTRGESFNFSVKVTDQNGSADILLVYFKLYRPDGTIVIPNSATPAIDYFTMVDNGDSNLGDAVAGDGIYSFKNSFGSTSATGNWTFEFRAKDRSASLSNVITQTVEVK